MEWRIYFGDAVFNGQVFPFLKDHENMLFAKEMHFYIIRHHVSKPLQTRELLQNSGIDFFSSSEFPGRTQSYFLT